MHRYELLMLTVPEITEDEAKSLETNIDKLLKEAKGTIISFEKWGKYRLAYPVRKNEYGVYFLARFEVDEPHPILDDIKSLFIVKLNEIVMRPMISALDPKESLAYHRPPSLEETPARDVDSFLKEHKMEGLLSSKSRPTERRTPDFKKEIITEITEKSETKSVGE